MEIIAILKRSLLFSGLDEEYLAEVAAITVRRSFAKGESLFSEGETATGFFLLRSLRHVVLPPEEASKLMRKRRIYFLFVIAAMQALLMFMLVR